MFYALLKWIEQSSDADGAYTLFYVAYYLPVALFSLPIGAWISNKILQHVMLFSNLFRLSVIVMFMLFMPYISYPWTYGLLIILSIMGLFFIPANQTLLQHIVSASERPKANSLLQMGFTVVKIIGQVLTALLIQLSATSSSLLLLSAVFLFISLWSIRNIKPLIRPEAKGVQKNGALMKEGIRYIANHRQLKPLFSFLAVAMFVATSIDLILIAYLTEVAQTGVEKLGYIGTSSMLGMILGAMIAPRWYRKLETKWLLIPPLFVLCVGIGSMSFLTDWMFMLPFFLIQGFALGCFNVTFVSYLQDVVAAEHYTRTFSLYHMIASAMALPGVIFMGLLLSQIGVIPTVLFVSATMLIMGIVGVFFIPRLGYGQQITADSEKEYSA